MADPLSIAAAGAGFLSLAGQITDGVVKLRSLYTTVKNAPQEVRHLCDELDIFRHLLEEADARVRNAVPSCIDTRHLSVILAQCGKMRAHLNAVLTKLDAGLRKHKVAAAKFPFKKKEIEEMLLRVERGKTSLLLANQLLDSGLASQRHSELSQQQASMLSQQAQFQQQQTCTQSKIESIRVEKSRELATISYDIAAATKISQRQVHDFRELEQESSRKIRDTLAELQKDTRSMSTCLADHVHLTATSVSKAEHTINEINTRLELLSLQFSSPDRIGTVTRTSVSFGLLPLSLTVETVTSHQNQEVGNPPVVRPVFTVKLPDWFLQQQYAVQLQHSTSGWLFSMAVHRVVPPDCLLFEACSNGDAAQVRMLISTGQASIYDRTPCGDTAFRFAIKNGHLEVCRLLQHAGIFSQFQARDYYAAMSALERSMIDFTDQNRALLRTIACCEVPDDDWIIEYSTEEISPNTTHLHADPEVLTLLTRAHHETALLKLSDLRAYFDMQLGASHARHTFILFIMRVVSDDAVIRHITNATQEYAWIVYGLAQEVARSFCYPNFGHDIWCQSVRNALHTILHAGLKPHQVSGALESPWIQADWHAKSTLTPLGTLCVEAWRAEIFAATRSARRARVRKRLRLWITGLHLTGEDLVKYAEQESSVYECGPDLLRIPWSSSASISRADGEISLSTGNKPEDWNIMFWEPCESFVRLFWLMVEGRPVMPGLMEGILRAHHFATKPDLSHGYIPGAWLSEPASYVESLDEWLLRRHEEVLAMIEEDLAMLDSAAFFAKWGRLTDILGKLS